MTSVLGIHHVTAIASDPQRNLDSYACVLGLRLRNWGNSRELQRGYLGGL